MAAAAKSVFENNIYHHLEEWWLLVSAVAGHKIETLNEEYDDLFLLLSLSLCLVWRLSGLLLLSAMNSHKRAKFVVGTNSGNEEENQPLEPVDNNNNNMAGRQTDKQNCKTS